MEALETLIAKGKIRAAGVCNYPVDLMTEARKTTVLASNQVPFSMVRRDIEQDIVPYCLKNNIGILAYSPLQRGLLTGKIRTGYKFNDGDSRPDTPYFREPNLSTVNSFLEKIKPIADGKNASLSQLVLNWTIHQPGITCALAGARNPAQAIENAGAADIVLSSEEINLINKYTAGLQIDTNI